MHGEITMFRIFERVLGMIVFGPPLYILLRFLKWYTRQTNTPDSQQ